MKYLFMILAVIAVSCNKKTIKPPVPVVDDPIITTQVIGPDTGTVPFIVPDNNQNDIPGIISDTIFFEFDSDNLTPESINKLKKIALKTKEIKIELLKLIGGACPIGDDLYNYRLSLRRGESVKQYLKDAACISAAKIYLYGNGETNLVSKVKSEYWKNRNCIILSM